MRVLCAGLGQALVRLFLKRFLNDASDTWTSANHADSTTYQVVHFPSMFSLEALE